MVKSRPNIKTPEFFSKFESDFEKSTGTKLVTAGLAAAVTGLGVASYFFAKRFFTSKKSSNRLLPKEFRGVFGGSGVGGLSNPVMCKTILSLVPAKPPGVAIKVLYLGTATYDVDKYYELQTARFRETDGVEVARLDVALKGMARRELERAVREADVLLVSGGNTLYAVNRWKSMGLDRVLRKAMHQGKVLCGGSAGAICWFDGGHSDSGDPASYLPVMTSPNREELENKCSKDWEYIRIPALGFVPGLLCPHHDQVQSNGVPRYQDFNQMLLRHPGELGICLDHWSALIINGEHLSVLSLPGKVGSVQSHPDGVRFNPDNGLPGIWFKWAENGEVKSKLCPSQGKVDELLRRSIGPIVQDARVTKIRDSGILAFLCFLNAAY